MRFSKAVAKYRIPILILTVLLMIPAVIGIANTRINYDMLNYLPEDILWHPISSNTTPIALSMQIDRNRSIIPRTAKEKSPGNGAWKG